jgi:hypothetical protein
MMTIRTTESAREHDWQKGDLVKVKCFIDTSQSAFGTRRWWSRVRVAVHPGTPGYAAAVPILGVVREIMVGDYIGVKLRITLSTGDEVYCHWLRPQVGPVEFVCSARRFIRGQ